MLSWRAGNVYEKDRYAESIHLERSIIHHPDQDEEEKGLIEKISVYIWFIPEALLPSFNWYFIAEIVY